MAVCDYGATRIGRSFMKKTEVIELLKGKTIKDISHGRYCGWFTIESITFTDGTILELGGNADRARIDDLVLPDGTYIRIEIDEE
jgi:hypothetical protein